MISSFCRRCEGRFCSRLRRRVYALNARAFSRPRNLARTPRTHAHRHAFFLRCSYTRCCDFHFAPPLSFSFELPAGHRAEARSPNFLSGSPAAPSCPRFSLPFLTASPLYRRSVFMTSFWFSFLFARRVVGALLGVALGQSALQPLQHAAFPRLPPQGSPSVYVLSAGPNEFSAALGGVCSA